MRATKGKALMKRGKIKLRVPMPEPMTSRVTGISMASRMMKGMERRKVDDHAQHGVQACPGEDVPLAGDHKQDTKGHTHEIGQNGGGDGHEERIIDTAQEKVQPLCLTHCAFTSLTGMFCSAR